MKDIYNKQPKIPTAHGIEKYPPDGYYRRFFGPNSQEIYPCICSWWMANVHHRESDYCIGNNYMGWRVKMNGKMTPITCRCMACAIAYKDYYENIECHRYKCKNCNQTEWMNWQHAINHLADIHDISPGYFVGLMRVKYHPEADGSMMISRPWSFDNFGNVVKMQHEITARWAII